MVAPVQKDSLTDYQVALATYLRITSPIAGMFTGTYGSPACGVIGLGRLSRLRCVSGFRCQLRSMNFAIETWSV